MPYEVEQKFRVSGFQAVQAVLAEFGSRIGPEVDQVDCYFTHPGRDFTVTGEAFRLRRIGSQNVITFKGPRIDLTTKTRREIELALPEGQDYNAKFTELLNALGFHAVANVHKRRRKAFVDFEGERVEVSLDEVTDLGTFVELELIADEAQVASARNHVAGLARRMGLADSERRSYLELLLLSRLS